MNHPLHEKALQAAKQYLASEVTLLETLQQIDKQKLFLRWVFPSLFQYAVKALRLAESQAFTLINVARKCLEVPALQGAIEAGELSVTKARRIVPVIEPETAADWIGKAVSMSKHELERAVVARNPEVVVREEIKPVYLNRSELRCGVTPQLEKKLDRVRALVAQSTGKPCSLESALDALCDVYLERRDPIKKAERVVKRAAKSSLKNADRASQPTAQCPLRTEPVAQPAVERLLQKAESISLLATESRPEKVAIRRHSRELDAIMTASAKPVVIRNPGNKPLWPDRFIHRKPIPMSLRHQIWLRDKGKCQHVGKAGQCGSMKWVEVHHRVPVSQGGANTAENLVTLCRFHHSETHGFAGAAWQAGHEITVRRDDLARAKLMGICRLLPAGRRAI